MNAVFDQFQGAEVPGFDGHLPGLDLGYVQYVADQLEQGGGGALDGVQVVLLARCQRGEFQEFQSTENPVQRGADLVAHGR